MFINLRYRARGKENEKGQDQVLGFFLFFVKEDLSDIQILLHTMIKTHSLKAGYFNGFRVMGCSLVPKVGFEPTRGVSLTGF